MKNTRRSFLAQGLALPLSLGLGSIRGVGAKESVVSEDLILGGGQFFVPPSPEPQFVFSAIHLKDSARRLARMFFLPHGIHRNPVQPSQIAIFEKKGPGACIFDLENFEIVDSIDATQGRSFYGHGAFSADGEHLFCTETFLDSLDGVIAIRDARSRQYLGDFPSFGQEPHECKLIDSGRTLVVTNGGGRLKESDPSVCYIDVESQKLIEKVNLTNEQLNTGHLAVSKNGSLVVVSAPRAGLNPTDPGGVSIRPRDEVMRSISNPKEITDKLAGEALSVAIHSEEEVAAVTHPDGDLVTFWSIASRKLLASCEMPSPRGVVVSNDKSSFLFSTGKEGNLSKIPVDNLEASPRDAFEKTFITGSHIYNWSGAPAELHFPKK